MTRVIRPRALALALALLLPLLAGCFETKYSLGPADSATVNPAYVGDFEVIDRANPGAERKTRVAIRNIDGKRYFVEWTDPDKPEGPTRMVGFTADVKGVTFAHLRNLSDDGSIPDTHLLMRVELKDNNQQLVLHNLRKEFFDDKNIDSDAKLRQVVEQGLDDSGMYEEGDVLAVRAPSK
jgi:hypothetical protein